MSCFNRSQSVVKPAFVVLLGAASGLQAQSILLDANAIDGLNRSQGLVSSVPDERTASISNVQATRAAGVSVGYLSDDTFHSRFQGSVAATPNSSGASSYSRANGTLSASSFDVVSFAGASSAFTVNVRYRLDYTYFLGSEFPVENRGGNGDFLLQFGLNLTRLTSGNSFVSGSTQTASFTFQDYLDSNSTDVLTGDGDSFVAVNLAPGEKLSLNTINVGARLTATGGSVFDSGSGTTVYNAVTGSYTVNAYLWLEILDPNVSIDSTTSPYTAGYAAPVPEPSASALLAGIAGLAVFGARRRNRR